MARTPSGPRSRYRHKTEFVPLRMTKLGKSCTDTGAARSSLSRADYLESLARRDNGIPDQDPLPPEETDHDDHSRPDDPPDTDPDPV
jgi:hypothetical protein